MDENPDSNIDRRSVMKMLSGATTAAVGFGAVSGSAMATDGRTAISPDEVTGKERKRAVRVARTSEEFKTLRKKFTADEGYHVSNLKDATVVEMEDPDGTPHKIVGTKLERKSSPASSSELDSASIALTLKDSNVVSAKAVVTTGDEASGQVSTSSPSEISVSAETYTVNGNTLDSETSSVTVDPEKATSKSGQITTQESNACWACTLIGNTICGIGCSVGAALICAAAGLAGGAPGIACGAIVSALCFIFSSAQDRFVGAGCGPDYGIEMACYYADYCAENPLL